MNNRDRKYLLALAMAFVMVGGQAQAAGSGSLTLTLQSEPVFQDQIFTVILGGANFTGTEGGSVQVSFDSSRLEFLDATQENGVFDIGPNAFAQDKSNEIVSVFAYGSPVTDPSFPIATLSFKALNSGNFTLSASNFLNSWLDDSGNQNPVNVTGTSINGAVLPPPPPGGSPVPVPGAVWLMGSALLGLIKLASRRH